MNYKVLIIIFSSLIVTESFSLNSRRVFKKKCSKCHTIGQETEKGPDLAGLEEKRGREWVKSFFETNDNQKAHNSKKYSGKKFEELFEYVYAVTAGSNEDIENSKGNPIAGRVLSSSCLSCHGSAGYASNPEIPNLRGQNAKYIINQLKAYRDGKREDPSGMMNNLAKSLTDRDIVNISAYYEHLHN